jgi:hypothetical protein
VQIIRRAYEQKFFGSFFKKEQEKALLFEKRSKNFGNNILDSVDARLTSY